MSLVRLQASTVSILALPESPEDRREGEEELRKSLSQPALPLHLNSCMPFLLFLFRCWAKKKTPVYLSSIVLLN